jgi:hypothetical protein
VHTVILIIIFRSKTAATPRDLTSPRRLPMHRTSVGTSGCACQGPAEAMRVVRARCYVFIYLRISA